MVQKRIAVVLPPRHPSNNILEGSGLLHDDVKARLLHELNSHSAISQVVSCDLGNAYVKDGKVYEGETCLSDFDLVHWYFATHRPNSWHVLMLTTLAKTTKVVPNPFGMLQGLDKFLSHTALRNAGLPTSNFTLFQASAVNHMADRLCDGKTILLKPRLGGFGHGIHMVKTARDLVDAVEYTQSFTKDNLEIFCEDFEENDISQWISTTIIDSVLVYGYRKRPEKFVDNWKVYDADKKGGGVDYVDPEPVKEIALAAAKALNCDIIGFDFIYSIKQNKYIIVDENTYPGMYPDCFKASGTGTWDQHFLRMILHHADISA